MSLANILSDTSQEVDVLQRQFRSTGETFQSFRIIDNEIVDIDDRYTAIYTRAINNSFIIGHAINGKVGSGTIGNYRGGSILYRVVAPDNIYFEPFKDTNFKNTVVTTATWDTTNHICSFASGNMAQSGTVIYNGGTINQGLIRATTSGTLVLWLAANGSTFEASTIDTTHSFTTKGSALVWKASASSLATINSLSVEAIY
jgi:hypothetical protein